MRTTQWIRVLSLVAAEASTFEPRHVGRAPCAEWTLPMIAFRARTEHPYSPAGAAPEVEILFAPFRESPCQVEEKNRRRGNEIWDDLLGFTTSQDSTK